MKESKKFKEIFKLKEMLDEENIEYEFKDRSVKGYDEFYQISCPNNREERYISVIEGFRNLWIKRR